MCVVLRDVALPLLSQDELDKQQAEKKKVSDILEELTQRREELQAQVRANTSSASITNRHTTAATDIASQTCVGVSEQVEELSTSLQTARGQQAAAGEELRRREETIGTLHSGDLIPPLTPLSICSSSGFYCPIIITILM